VALNERHNLPRMKEALTEPIQEALRTRRLTADHIQIHSPGRIESVAVRSHQFEFKGLAAAEKLAWIGYSHLLVSSIPTYESKDIYMNDV